jgi:protein O-mannosyl-transferase
MDRQDAGPTDTVRLVARRILYRTHFAAHRGTANGTRAGLVMNLNRHSHLVYLTPLAFLCIAWALFHGGFDAPLYYDSAILKENEHAFAGQGLRGVINLFPQRPATMASFYLNYLVAGLDPWYFRTANAFILALSASLAGAVTLLLLQTPVMEKKGTPSQRVALAVLLGVVFLVHPVQTFLVLYIWQRMALLSCFFYLAALAVYLLHRTGRLKRPLVGYGLCFVLFVLAMASKENAVALPGMLILVELAFFREGRRDLLLRVAVCSVALVMVVGGLSFLERPHGTEAGHAGIVNTLGRYYQESGLTLAQVFITQCRLLFHYLAAILIPTSSRILLVAPQVIFGSLLTPLSSLAAVMAAVATPAVGLWLLVRRPLTGFGILFFMGNLLPEAFLVPQFLFFVYRAALPMLGIFLIVTDVALEILERTQRSSARAVIRVTMGAVLVAGIVAMGSVTFSKAQAWNDPVAVWSEVVASLPAFGGNVEPRGTVNALNNLGIALQKKGRASEAVFYHARAVAVDPSDVRNQVLLGKACLREGRLTEAETAMRAALELVPDHADALMGLAIVFLQRNRLPEAAGYAKRVVELAPGNPQYRNDLAAILLGQGDLTGAIHHFNRAIELNPDFVTAQYQLSRALWASGRPEEAIKQLERTVKMKPDHARARNDLAMILAQVGRVGEAADQLRMILRLNPNDSVARDNLENLLRERETKP